jgi:Holliday junction resolvase RusA-like endonuclease
MSQSVSIPFPLEVVIEATPVSAQSSSASRDAWKQLVAAGTRQRLREVTDWYWLERQPLSVTIFYFPDAPMEGDIDNIVKPILDAMKTIVYHDDDVVERVLVQRFEPGLAWSFGGLPRSLPSPWIERVPLSTYASIVISRGGRFHDSGHTDERPSGAGPAQGDV